MNKQELIEKWGEPQRYGHDGFARLVDYMGDDDAIAEAARVSYQKGTKQIRDNSSLIRYLMRHKHYSPFAMCQVKLHLRMPLFINVQALRHDRFHWNMMSARYSEMPVIKWEPIPEALRAQSTTNKQVGSGSVEESAALEAADLISSHNANAEATYKKLLELGVCREQARTVLPMGQYTEGYATATLGDWMMFLAARLKPNAQKEIQELALVVAGILQTLFPVAMQAFRDYQLNAVTFSAQEMAVLRTLLSKPLGSLKKELRGNPGWQTRQELELSGWTHTYDARPNAFGGPDPVFEKPKTLFNMPQEERVDFLEAHNLNNKRERVEFFKKLKGEL